MYGWIEGSKEGRQSYRNFTETLHLETIMIDKEARCIMCIGVFLSPCINVKQVHLLTKNGWTQISGVRCTRDGGWRGGRCQYGFDTILPLQSLYGTRKMTLYVDTIVIQ
jgi:hypothetical protein